jgi:hypothetical protein
MLAGRACEAHQSSVGSSTVAGSSNIWPSFRTLPTAFPTAQTPENVLRCEAQHGVRIAVSLAKPGRPILPLDDHRHSVPDFGESPVGIRGNGGERLQEFAFGRLTRLPGVAEGHGFANDTRHSAAGSLCRRSWR